MGNHISKKMQAILIREGEIEDPNRWRNQAEDAREFSGLPKHGKARLATILARSVDDTLDRSLLPEDVKHRLRQQGIDNPAEASILRLRDSQDPNHNKHYWSLILSLHKHHTPQETNTNPQELDMDALLSRLQAVEAEIIELEGQEGEEENAQGNGSDAVSGDTQEGTKPYDTEGAKPQAIGSTSTAEQCSVSDGAQKCPESNTS